jgi:PKD repeat protein
MKAMQKNILARRVHPLLLLTPSVVRNFAYRRLGTLGLLLATLLSALPAAAQTSGGPDAYGYTWKTSAHPTAPPAYQWVDISTRGTEVDGLADDNIKGPYTLPSGFQFYWYPITQFYIGSNGYINFNGANIAAPFPASVPLASGGNNWIAGHMADLNFDGANNPATCYYLANADSLIVSFINVPYWNVTAGYTGSNTFQIIYLKASKHIHINYQSMNAGITPLPVDCVTGIENSTGALGLASHLDAVPANQSAVRFYYPGNVTYAVTDAGINWNNNPRDRGYFVPVGPTGHPIKTNIKNFGNQPLGTSTVTDTVYSYGTVINGGNASVPALLAGEDTTLTLSNLLYATFPGALTVATRLQGVAGDMVPSNNRKTQKVVAVQTSPTAQYFLDYSDQSANGVGLSWNGGNGGIAVYYAPPKYPVKINGAQFFHTGNGTPAVGFSAMLYDDNGPNGGPGTRLDSVFVQSGNVLLNAYTSVVFNPASGPIYKTSGGVYLVWYMGGNGITLARDNTVPISGQSYEVLGNAWAEYRDRWTEDFLMGLAVSAAPLPTAQFSIDSSAAPNLSFTDLSLNNPTSWNWTFGDGSTSGMQNPLHSYAANGRYTVCLTATNTHGSHTACKNLSIKNIGLTESHVRSLQLAPNPAHQAVWIRGLGENPSAQWTVTNALGQVVNKNPVWNGSEWQLSTAGWPASTYWINAVTSDGRSFRGFWVQQ